MANEPPVDPPPDRGPTPDLDAYRTAVERSADGIAFLDSDLRHTYANSAYASLLGYDGPEALEGLAWSMLLSSEEYEKLVDRCVSRLQRGEPWRGDVLVQGADEAPFSGEATFTPLDDERTVCVLRPLGDHGSMQRQLERMAFFDPLTGLANRRLLSDRAEQALALARRNGTPVALLYLDLDSFKEVNDALGHGVGDAVLEESAVRLQACVRETDTAARVGGDEFAVLLPDPGGEAGTIQVGERILESLERPILAGDHELTISASIGVSFFPRSAYTFEELLRQADQAMYGVEREKQVGVRVYRSGPGLDRERFAEIVDDLHKALRHYRFELHYQPIRDLRGGEVVGAQGLLRWPHPRFGTLAAAKFVPLVEEAGLIERVDRWVLANAALQLRGWNELGYEGWVAVHLSEQSCRDPGTAEYLERALGLLGEVERDRLLIQLPVMADSKPDQSLVSCIRALSSVGPRVAVRSDVSSGDAGDFLRDVRPSVVALEPTVVGEDSPRNGRLERLRRVVSGAHSTGSRVLAKGVERSEQRRHLQEAGCDFSVGFLEGWIVPPEKFLNGHAEPGG